MLISSMEGYFEYPLVQFFGRAYALSVGFKNETSKSKRFPALRQKPAQILS